MPPVPALPDAARLTTYAPVASAGPFAVGFALYGDSTDYTNWIQVFLDGVQQTSGWTLSSPSGSLSTLARPITDAQITFTAPITGALEIVGAQRPRRLAQNDENRGVTARDWNQAYTALVAMERELWDLRSRLPLIPPDATSPLLPAKAARALQGLGFDANGNFIAMSQAPAGVISAGMADVVAAPDHATALALLGGGSTLSIPIGQVAAWPGLFAPSMWRFANSDVLSRVTFPELLAVLAPTIACVVASGSNIITGIASTAGFGSGWPVEGAAFSAGTTITSVLDGTRVQLNQPAIVNAASAQFFIHGNGDGSTTFNLPNYEDGSALIGLDLAQAKVTGGHRINATLGEQAHLLAAGEMPVHTHAFTGDPHHHSGGDASQKIFSPAAGISTIWGGTSNNTGDTTATGTNATAGGGLSHNNIQPSRVARVIIYAGH